MVYFIIYELLHRFSITIFCMTEVKSSEEDSVQNQTLITSIALTVCAKFIGNTLSELKVCTYIFNYFPST